MYAYILILDRYFFLHAQAESSPALDKKATKALTAALLDGDETKALAAYTAVDKASGVSLEFELHPSLPLAGGAGGEAGHTPLHLAAAGCMQILLVRERAHR
jgi:hypothetical protein